MSHVLEICNQAFSQKTVKSGGQGQKALREIKITTPRTIEMESSESEMCSLYAHNTLA